MMEAEFRDFRRGDVIMVNNPFQSPHGSVMCGNHPAVIVQNNVGNFHSPNLVIVYLTSGEYPTGVRLSDYDFLYKTTVANASQIATISKEDVIKTLGQLTELDMARLEKAILVELGMAGREVC